MSTSIPTRDQAFALLCQYNQNDGLIKHALAVEGVMRYMARHYGEDEEMWGIIGLVHDLDYEQFPEEHCKKTEEILRKNQWPEAYIRAVISHGWGICTDVKPESTLEKVLYAVDELTGLVTAAALVRPSKSVMDMKAKSVKKKWKSKRFAAGVDRNIIETGADMLGMQLGELITATIMGMREVAETIGLDPRSRYENQDNLLQAISKKSNCPWALLRNGKKCSHTLVCTPLFDRFAPCQNP